MSALKPSATQMLEIGKGLGLLKLEEAYENYMLHYDLFFLISDYAAQYKQLVEELTSAGLVQENRLRDMTITDAEALLYAHSRKGG